MTINKQTGEVEIYFDDLSDAAQQELVEAYGTADANNWDITPLAVIVLPEVPTEE